MAISTATVPGALFGALISSGTPNVRYVKVGKTLIMWDDKDVTLLEETDLGIGYPVQFTTKPKTSLFSHSISRKDLVESVEKSVKGGVTVTTVGKFMAIRDANKDA